MLFQKKRKKSPEIMEYEDTKITFNGMLEKYKYIQVLSKETVNEEQDQYLFMKSAPPLKKYSKTQTQSDQNNSSLSSVTNNGSSIIKYNNRKRKLPKSYVPPEHYAHLPSGVPDVLDENLIVIFVGLNPGIATVKAGHAYAGKTNLFWKLLHSSKIVCSETILRPEDDVTLQKWDVGMTNLVSRPTSGSNELSKEEMLEGVPILEKKVSTFCPLSVCIVGKGIYEAIYRYKTGKSLSKTFEWGWQPEKIGTSENFEGALIYVVPSTSGRAATYSRKMKEDCWNTLGEWVIQKRKERDKSKNTLNEL